MATLDNEDDGVLVCWAVNMASAGLLMCKTAMELEKTVKKITGCGSTYICVSGRNIELK